MFAKLGLLVILVLLASLAGMLLLSDTRRGGEAKAAGRMGGQRSDKGTKKIGTRLFGGPLVSVCSDTGVWSSYRVNRSGWTAGRSLKADCIIDDETISGRHFRIYKVKDGERFEYYLQNLSSKNPIEILNSERRCYEFLHFKESVLLEGRKIFYVGNRKMIIDTPVLGHRAGTEEEELLRRTEEEPDQKDWDGRRTRIYAGRGNTEE